VQMLQSDDPGKRKVGLMIPAERAFIVAVIFAVLGVALGILVSFWVELIFGLICLGGWAFYVWQED
jgi:hypothetical protein